MLGNARCLLFAPGALGGSRAADGRAGFCRVGRASRRSADFFRVLGMERHIFRRDSSLFIKGALLHPEFVEEFLNPFDACCVILGRVDWRSSLGHRAC